VTVPWIIGAAIAGLVAGPRIRVSVFSRGGESGQPPRRDCPSCAREIRPTGRLGRLLLLPVTSRCPACGARIGPPPLTAEVAGLEVSIAAAGQKPRAMEQLAARHQVTHLGMPDFRPSADRSSGAVGGS
jgi:hypothetical protein